MYHEELNEGQWTPAAAEACSQHEATVVRIGCTAFRHRPRWRMSVGAGPWALASGTSDTGAPG